MKNQNTQITGRICQLGLAALLTTGLTVQAQTPLYTGHADVGLAYDVDANEWELHVHDGESDVEYFPATDARLMVRHQAHTTVPAGAQWSFLGAPGSSTWILPATEDEDLLFLGIGTEEIDPGTFTGNSLSLALKAVSGPGNFALYDTDSFGDPLLRWNSADGFSGADVLTLSTGGHAHFNWAFSAPGDYTITLEAFGESALHGFTSSGDVSYLFRVEAVPEPTMGALLGLGGMMGWWASRRKKK